MWEVWRQDDNGRRFRTSTFDDRIEALATVLALKSGPQKTYWLEGPPEPVCHTNRDLYVRVVREGKRMDAASRSLDAFLRAWWHVGQSLSSQARFDLDTVAAMVAAAGTVEPPPLREAWRTATYHDTDEPTTFADWEAIVLSQIADLADFADHGPLSKYAALGAAVPRAEGCVRATAGTWYNFDPQSYLECGLAGSLGGWAEDDGLRKPVPGPVVPLVSEPEPGEHPVDALDWADLADLARCGQEYE